MITYPMAMGDLQTRVIEAGSGPKTLFFIHGLGARADRWHANLPALADAGAHDDLVIAVALAVWWMEMRGECRHSGPLESVSPIG